MRHLLAVDPGRSKTGLAVIAKATGKALLREIVENPNRREALKLIFAGYDIETVVCGDGTGHAPVAEEIATLLAERPADTRPPLYLTDERNSTYRARFLYLDENPPAFPLCLLPRGLVPVTIPLDHYAAYAIGLKYLEDVKLGRIPFNKNIGL